VSWNAQGLQKSVVGVIAVATFAGVGTVVSVDAAMAATQTLVATGNVNMRSGPSTRYAILLTVIRGASVTATGTTSGAWIQVTYGGKTGYVYSTYVKAATAAPATTTAAAPAAATGSRTTTGSVNVRSGPGTSYTIVGVAVRGSSLPTTGLTSGSWTQVVWGGVNRWVSTSYLGAAAPAPTASAPAVVGPIIQTPSVRIQKVIDYATSKLGASYVWGGAGPTSFDCSGLTQAAYAQIGVSLLHKASYQATGGTAVARANLVPGDLIFWYTPVGHVSLYIGNGQMIHARSTAYGVVQQSVDSYIAAGGLYVGARRYVS
jgi:peptidoglycan DL-endopeptidase CwlO